MITRKTQEVALVESSPYRKPNRFDQIIGQPNAARLTKKQARQMHKSNHGLALLFTGDYGVGKTLHATTLLRWMRCINNPGPDFPLEEPCGKCPSCQSESSIGKENLIDIFNCGRMDDEWHFTHMLENFQFCPGSGYYLRILDEIHALTLAQQEALLQDMENLPNQLIVVACSAHPERLDLPFRSRFSEIKFSLIEQSLISNHLKDQIALRRLPVKPAFTDMIAYEAAGHLRTAILRLNLMATAQQATIDDCVDLLSIPHPKDILSWLVALFTSPEAANDSLIGLLKTKSPGPIIRVAKDLLKQSVWRDQKPSEGIPTPLLGAEWESFKAMFTIEQRLILAEAVINIDDGVIANLDSFLLKNAILSAQVCPPEFLPE